jgi:hypothetical protein
MKPSLMAFALGLLAVPLPLFVAFHTETFGWTIFLIVLESFLYGLFIRRFSQPAIIFWSLAIAVGILGQFWIEMFGFALVLGLPIFLIALGGAFSGSILSDSTKNEVVRLVLSLGTLIIISGISFILYMMEKSFSNLA